MVAALLPILCSLLALRWLQFHHGMTEGLVVPRLSLLSVLTYTVAPVAGLLVAYAGDHSEFIHSVVHRILLKGQNAYTAKAGQRIAQRANPSHFPRLRGRGRRVDQTSVNAIIQR